jgi:thiol-disulfide isomerase/thioredoxin
MARTRFGHGGGLSVQKFLRDRRSLLAAGATLLAGGTMRQAEANGLQRLVEHPEAKALPEGLSFTDAEGRQTDFNAFRGRALVVNFWATWCPPCVAEMPALDRLHAQVAREGIEVLALSNDRGGRAQVEPFYQRTNLRHMAIWLDPRGATGRTLGVRVLPTTIIIDRRGLEVARLMARRNGTSPRWSPPSAAWPARGQPRTAPAPDTGFQTCPMIRCPPRPVSRRGSTGWPRWP